MSSGTANPITQIAIVGVGQVGGAAAYALLLDSVASELLLVDTDVDLRDGQVRDLSDAAYGSGSRTRVRAATYREAGQSDIVVITAGSKYALGETRIQFMYRNISIVRNIIDEMTPFGSKTILLIVANPVDLLTSLAHKLSGIPTSQVLGSGTFLDSVRFRGLVADKTGGDAEVVAWSAATIGGAPMAKYLPSIVDRAVLVDECRHRSQSIVEAKGAMPFGIGSIVTSICSSILFDRRNIRPISHFQPDHGCCISLPVVLGRSGIVRTVQVNLSRDEEACLVESAKSLKRTFDDIKEGR